jgi:hypothetical protein
MPALVAGIHVLMHPREPKAWMAGTSPAMTGEARNPQAAVIATIPTAAESL